MLVLLILVGVAVSRPWYAAWEWPWTPVSQIVLESAKEGDVERLADLLGRSVNLDLDQRHPGGFTAMMAAAFKKQDEMVQFLIDAGADPNFAASNGWTPIAAASAAGHVASINVLLKERADVNRCSEELLLCPVHIAASRGHTAAIRALVAGGANASALTKAGNTAAQEADLKGHSEVVLALQDIAPGMQDEL